MPGDAKAGPAFRPLTEHRSRPPAEVRERAEAFAAELRRRRTVRSYATRPVSREVIESCLWAAASAPSGGLATLTHTPSPMDFLNRILGRPENERPFLLLVTGHPAGEARVPVLDKKPLEEIATFV